MAGRTQFELFDIEENKFTFKSRYVLGRPMLCLMDISWSRLEESLIVACASNGELYRLIVSESEIIGPNPSAEPIVYHEKNINKIHFHPNVPNYLISGGQDGLVKLIDFRLRSNAIVQTFYHDTNDRV